MMETGLGLRWRRASSIVTISSQAVRILDACQRVQACFASKPVAFGRQFLP